MHFNGSQTAHALSPASGGDREMEGVREATAAGRSLLQGLIAHQGELGPFVSGQQQAQQDVRVLFDNPNSNSQIIFL